MPITTTFDPALGIAVVTVVAPYTFDEWRRAIDQVLAERPGPASVLVDRRAGGVPATDFVEEIVSYARAHADRLSGSTAAVVVGAEAAVGMARMVATRQLPMTVKVFLEYDDAVRWLKRIDPV